MFKFLTKLKQSLQGNRGQVAIILIFIVAIALIMFAITTNVGKMTQTKTVVTAAADSGAAQMASFMASYGQSLFKTQLGGEKKKCESGGLVKLIINYVLFEFFLNIAFGPLGGALSKMLNLSKAATTAMKISAAVTAVAVGYSTYVYLADINPMITEQWNKISTRTLTQRDQFLEQGIATALRQAVSDPVMVRDFYDSDEDTFYDNPLTNERVDEISRFSHYYDRRIRGVVAPDYKELNLFKNKLECLVAGKDECASNEGLPDEEVWALTDPIGENGVSVEPPVCVFDPDNPDNPLPSVCNVCCVPENVVGSNPLNPIPLRPSCCAEDALARCGNANICADYSPYGAEHPYVYDETLENPYNNIVSFREKLGRDDENPDYFRKPGSLVDPLDATLDTSGVESKIRQQAHDPALGDFMPWDATGFPDNDLLTGAYTFFNLGHKWIIDLNELSSAVSGKAEKEPCFWVANNQRIPSEKCAPDWDYDHPLFISPEYNGFLFEGMALPLYPDHTTDLESVAGTVEAYGPRINVETYVDPGIDIVTFPEGFVAENDQCAQTASDADPSIGFWKAGADKYCSATFPYDTNCSKHTSPNCTEPNGDEPPISVDCSCVDPGANPAQFNEDSLDDIVYGLKDFVEFTDTILELNTSTFQRGLEQWYDTAAQWFEPAAGTGDCYACNTDSLGNPVDGRLHMIHKKIQMILARLILWRDTSYANDAAWCMPASASSMADGEADTFDFNSNGIDGDMEDVLACLNWNANDDPGVSFDREGELLDQASFEIDDIGTVISVALPSEMTDGEIIGNASKFEHCALTCSQEACEDLPRSMVELSSFSGNAGSRKDELEDLLACFYDCDECTARNVKFENPRFDEFGDPVLEPDPGGAMEQATDPVTGDPLFEERIDPVTGLPVLDPVTGEVIMDPVMVPVMIQVIDEYEPNCSNFLQIQEPLPPDNGLTEPIDMKQLIINEIGEINSICRPSYEQDYRKGGQSGWIDRVRQSAFEAANQVPKFQKRAQYLSKIWAGINGLIEVLEPAERRFDAFLNGGYEDDSDPVAAELNGAVADLIRARRKLDNPDQTNDAQLPYHVIYAWQDPPKEGQLKEDAKWHVVRVDARVPGRCDDACGPTQAAGDKQILPKVRAYDKGFLGTTKCYELQDDTTSGVVKVRVTRFDGPRFEGEDVRNVLSFPNGAPIWTFKTQNSKVLEERRVEIEQIARSLPGDCQVAVTRGPSGDPDAFAGAFMISNPTQKTRVVTVNDALDPTDEDYETVTEIPDPNNAQLMQCWRRMTELLSVGVMSETCAQYYYHEGGDLKGFSFQFVDCKDHCAHDDDHFCSF